MLNYYDKRIQERFMYVAKWFTNLTHLIQEEINNDYCVINTNQLLQKFRRYNFINRITKTTETLDYLTNMFTERFG